LFDIQCRHAGPNPSKALTKKRAALGFRRQELIKALKDIDCEIRVLVVLQRNAAEVAVNPAAWMPWNYQATLADHNAGPDSPA
jgi:hypothetical protein